MSADDSYLRRRAALSAREAADYLGISLRSFRRLAAARRLRGVRLGARLVRYRVADLERLLEAR